MFRSPYFINGFHQLKTGTLADVFPWRWILDSIEPNSFAGTATAAIWNKAILERFRESLQKE